MIVVQAEALPKQRSGVEMQTSLLPTSSDAQKFPELNQFKEWPFVGQKNRVRRSRFAHVFL